MRRLLFEKRFQKQLKKIKQKNLIMFRRVLKKIDEIAKNPKRYKSLKNELKGVQRVHFGPFVMLFEATEDKVLFLHIKHHDIAYSASA